MQGTAQAPRGNPDLRGTAKTTDAIFIVGWFAMLAVATAASIDRLALLLSAPPSWSLSAFAESLRRLSLPLGGLALSPLLRAALGPSELGLRHLDLLHGDMIVDDFATDDKGLKSIV